MAISPMEIIYLQSNRPKLTSPDAIDMYLTFRLLKTYESGMCLPIDITASRGYLKCVLDEFAERGWFIATDKNAGGYRVYMADEPDKVKGLPGMLLEDGMEE